jgi:disulfide oxidoreductase YuzD
LGKELRQSYGEKVEVKYIDTDQTGLKPYPSVAKVIKKGYSFPVVAVDGEPRMAGGIDTKAIRAILDEHLTKPK